MSELVVGPVAAGYLLQTRLVTEILKILVVLRHTSRTQELDHPRVGQRVEVPAQHQLYVGCVCARVFSTQRRRRLFEDRLQLVAEHHRLDELDVAELGIPVYVRGAHEEGLLDEGRV